MITFSKSAATRGMRNNNPFNIVRNKCNKWLGRKLRVSDRKFEEFESIDYGVRAGVKLLIGYIRRKNIVYGKCNTIEKIVTRFAPAVENDPLLYIKFLEHYVGIDRHQEIKYPSMEFAKLCCGIMFYESQYVAPVDYIYVIINQFKLW